LELRDVVKIEFNHSRAITSKEAAQLVPRAGPDRSNRGFESHPFRQFL